MKINIKKIGFIGLVCLCGVVIAIIYATPHFVAKKGLSRSGAAYFPLSIEGGFLTRFHDEVAFYVPRAREVALDGHLYASDFELFEHIGDPVIMNLGGPIIMAPFFYFGKTVTNFVVYSDIFFSFVSFFILFALFFVVTKKRYFSLAFALISSVFQEIGLLLFSPSIDSAKTLIKHFIPLYGIETWEASISDLVKMEAMKPGLPFLLTFLIFLYLSLEKKDKWAYSIFAGVFGGLLFYTYFFHWGFAVVGMGLIFGFLLLLRDFERAKNLFYTMFIAGLVSIPYWINYIFFKNHPQFEELMLRSGIEISHTFRWGMWKEYILFVAAALIIWFIYKKKNRNLAVFLIPLLLSGIVLYNIQVITGWQNQPDRWGSKSLLIIYNLFFAVVIVRIFEALSQKKKKIFSFIIACVVILLLFNAFWGKIIWSNYFYSTWTIPKNITESFDWLNKNTPMDSVIMTSSIVTNRYIPLYTHNRTFTASSGYGQLSCDETLDRLYIAYKLFKVPEDYFTKVFFVGKKEMGTSNNSRVSINLFERRGIDYLFNFGYTTRALDSPFESTFSDGDKKEIIAGYNNIMKIKNSFLLNKYRADYFYYGPKEKEIVPNLNPNNINFLEQVYNDGGVEIYKINHSKIWP